MYYSCVYSAIKCTYNRKRGTSMKETKPRYKKERHENDFITDLQRKCISDISVLCASKKRAAKKRRIYGAISMVFMFISLLTLCICIILRYILRKDDSAYSIISVISAAITLISAALAKKEATMEEAGEKEIGFLEDVIESSDNV